MVANIELAPIVESPEFAKSTFISEKKGIAVLGLPTTREELCEANEKRDDLAELFIKKSRSYMEDKDCRNALRFATYAVFYARSEKTKGTALLSRSYVLFGMKYFRDAIQDAMEALKVQFATYCTCLKYLDNNPAMDTRLCIYYSFVCLSASNLDYSRF